MIKLDSATEFCYDVMSIREGLLDQGAAVCPHKRALNGGTYET